MQLQFSFTVCRANIGLWFCVLFVLLRVYDHTTEIYIQRKEAEKYALLPCFNNKQNKNYLIVNVICYNTQQNIIKILCQVNN